MSLISRSELTPTPSIDQINMQSYDHKIYDNLFENILQFLPLTDKFRLECVSKQFQKTIFKRVSSVNAYKSVKFNLEEFECVLKKCPNIRYISLSDSYYDNEEKLLEYNLIIDLIIRYCDKLEFTECYYSLMSDTNKHKFFEKFGSKVKKMYLQFWNTSDGNVLQLTPNIEEFVLTICNSSVNYNQIKFNKLKKLDIHFCDNRLIGFPTLFTNNPSIEEFSLYLLTHISNEMDFILKQISRLSHLIRLQIHGSPKINEMQFERSLKQIANDCLNLKTINCEIGIDFDNNPQLDGLLSPLEVFKQINCLEICVIFDEIHEIKNFSFKVFKNFEGLTHLKLMFAHNSESISDIPVKRIDFKEEILIDIDINLPKLQYLYIDPSFVHIIASNWTLIILKRLPFLHTIILKVSDDSIKDIIRSKLNEHKEYKTIEL